MRYRLAWVCLLGVGALWGVTAFAQTLSQGDYEQCRVYDRHGDYSGLSNECLERKRARIRRFQSVSPPAAPTVPQTGRFQPIDLPQRCPLWANNGQGFVSTWLTSGQGPGITLLGRFDSMVNGRPCLPGAYITPGYP